MEPLMSTAGMKEGSLNENQVLHAISDFLKKNEAFGAVYDLKTKGDFEIRKLLVIPLFQLSNH